MWAKSKKTIFWIVGLFLAVLAGSIGKQLGGELFKPSKAETLSHLVSEAASRINAQAPKKLDEITTLVRAEALNGNKLATYYTLKDYDSYAKDFSLSAVKVAVTKNVCDKQSRLSESPLALGMTHRYIYTRENGTEIGSFEVSRKDCYQTR